MADKSFWQKYKLTWSWILVLLWVLFVDFVWHILHEPAATFINGLLLKVIWMIAFSITYMLVYEQAAKSWRSPAAPNGKGLKITMSDFKNSVLFSFFTSIVIIAVISYTAYMVVMVYTYFLTGIRGDIPEDGLKDGALVIQVVGSGLILEICGKDETDTGAR